MKRIFPCLLALAAVSETLAADTSSPTASASVKTFRDLAYVTDGHERHTLDLYLPEHSTSPVPLLIWVHGGGWQNGSKENVLPLRQGWLERGYAIASLNYRLSGDAVFPAQIEDCKAAIRWLRAHAEDYGLDAERFGGWGSSAGGHLVALLGTSGGVEEFEVGAHLDQSSRVQAICDYYGPTDFTAFVTQPGYESHASATSPEAKLIGGAVLENPTLAERVNPITYVSGEEPPFLIVHGDSDPVVPIQQSELLYEALKKTGGSVHFHTIKGAGHGQGFTGPEILTMVSEFFDSHLLAGSEPPPKEAKNSESTASERTAGTRPSTPSSTPGRPQPGPGSGRGQMPSFDEILFRSDKNGDGKLSRDEFRGPPALFDRLDSDGDGFVTREEHAAAFPGNNRPTPAAAPAAPGAMPGSPGSPDAANNSPAGFSLTGFSLTGFSLTGERWTYRDGDFAMSGILLKPEGEGPFPAVLISHGLGGSAQSFGLQKARQMVGWGLVCIAPDYTHTVRAHGAPSPDFGASEENVRRALTCLDMLAKMPDVDASRLAAYGHSMGGFVTIGLAADAPGRLKAAAITGSGVAPRDGYAAPSLDRAEKVRTPFLILHGTEDTTVRPEQSASFKEVLDRNQVPSKRTLFEGEEHPIDQSKREEVFGTVREWFVRNNVFPEGNVHPSTK